MAKTINRTQMNTYWLERAERNYIAGEKGALQLAEELRLNYNQAIKEIDDRISSFYGRYAKETGLSLEDAKQLLNRNELRDFKSYINEMLKMGEKKNFSPQEMYEFRRLYNKAKITRLEQLQANIRAELDKLASNTKNKVEDLLADSYEDGYYKTIYDTQMEFGIDKAFTGLNKQAVEKAVNQKYLQGNYSSRIWENNTKVLSSLLNREIPRGITLGYNPRKLARDVVSPKINKTLYNNTVRLIRTEYGHVLNQATLQGYRQAGISRYKISTTLDSRRCEDCGAYEGEIVNIDEVEEGINCPPFHPNCRCTTIPYFPEDYIDRMTDEELDQIGFVTYQDWKDGLVKLENGKVIYNNTSNQKAINNINLELSDFPSQFSSKSFVKDTNNIMDYINNQSEANPDVINLYKNLGKNQSVPFTLHRSKNTNRLEIEINTITQKINKVDLSLPKLDMESTHSINTWLHETAHFIDFNFNNSDGAYKGYYSGKYKPLSDLLSKRDLAMGTKVSNLFEAYNKEYREAYRTVNAKYNEKLKEINSNYEKGIYSSYKEYKDSWNKVMKELKSNRELAEQKVSNKYNGIEAFEDIYDALSGGVHYSSGNVINGHGQSYYMATHFRVEEIFANYCALSITNPEYINILSKDKPELVNLLNTMIVDMSK